MYTAHFRLLRISTSGDVSYVPLESWSYYSDEAAKIFSGTTENIVPGIAITNADNGVVVSWDSQVNPGGGSSVVNAYHLAITSGTEVIAQSSTNSLITPVLQSQDGTFFGSDAAGHLIHFDQSAKVIWSIPNDSPKIATADGGVIGTSGITYDSNGKATGNVGSLPIQSWTGNGYINGVNQVAFTAPDYATSFGAMTGGNPSASSPAPQSTFAPAPSNGPYVGSVTLYIRNFAPWSQFGPDPYADVPPYLPVVNPCILDCFKGDNRTFSTSLTVTSRINGVVHLLLPAMAPFTTKAFSNVSTALYRFPPLNTRTALPRLKKVFVGNGHWTFHMEGANPLVLPSPDIDTHLDITGTSSDEQYCFSGSLDGDAFPNTEVFVVNSKGQATSLLTYATTQDRNIGPFTLVGDNHRPMGSFSNICTPK